jgi:hypothetical protein
MPYGDGTVFQRGWDARWIARIEVGRDQDGKRVRRQVSGTTREEVERKLAELRESLADGDTVLP